MGQITNHIVRIAKEARRAGYGALSEDERVAAAMALNRSDWLAELGYSIGEAIGRLDPNWTERIPGAARFLSDDSIASQLHNTNLTEIGLTSGMDDDEVPCNMKNPGVRKLHDQ